jgi:hypothetical protein
MRGLEEGWLWGAQPKVLKGQAKRPGAGKRKEARGEAQGAEQPRVRRPGRASRGGRERPTAAGRWRGQLPNPGKAAPEPTHLSVQTAWPEPGAYSLGPEVLPNLRVRKPARGTAGRPATKSRPGTQLLTSHKAAGGPP